MVTEEDVYKTALLLNISINKDEAKSIQKSLSQLVKYFFVMEKALADSSTDEPVSVDTIDPKSIAQYRQDQAVSYPNTESLIERSEEHEENFVIIPNIL